MANHYSGGAIHIDLFLFIYRTKNSRHLTPNGISYCFHSSDRPGCLLCRGQVRFKTYTIVYLQVGLVFRRNLKVMVLYRLGGRFFAFFVAFLLSQPKCRLSNAVGGFMKQRRKRTLFNWRIASENAFQKVKKVEKTLFNV